MLASFFQNIYIDLFLRNNIGYFVAYFIKCVGEIWYDKPSCDIRMIVAQVTKAAAWEKNQVTWPHGTKASGVHVTMLEVGMFGENFEHLPQQQIRIDNQVRVVMTELKLNVSMLENTVPYSQENTII